MGLLLSEIIVDIFRQAVPIVGAVTGAYFGMKRAQRTGKRPIVNVAAFSGLGWFAGYVVNRGVMRVLDGRSPQLPVNTMVPATLPPPSMEMPPPPVVTPPMSGMNEVDMYKYTAQSITPPGDANTAAPPPRTQNAGVEYGPLTKRNRIGKSLNLAAFGQLYGNG